MRYLTLLVSLLTLMAFLSAGRLGHPRLGCFYIFHPQMRHDGTLHVLSCSHTPFVSKAA